MLELIAAPGDVLGRSHHVPGHFTASAFVLSPDATALLLIFHRRLGHWLQPGGHLEAGDASVVAAARREVREESGLVALDDLAIGVGGAGAEAECPGDGALLDLDVHPIPAHAAEPAHEHFDVRVLLRARSAALAPGVEVGGACWVPLAEMAAAMTDESVRRVAAKLAGLLEVRHA